MAEGEGVHVARFRTADLPPNDRFAAWREMTSNAHFSTSISTEHERDFEATTSLLDLGVVQVSSMSYPPLRAKRTARLIRQSDPGLYLVSLTIGGRVRFDHAGRDTVAGQGEIIVIDASLPGDVDNDLPLNQMIIQFPKDQFSLPPRLVERALTRCMSTRRGLGALVMNFTQQLMESAEDYAPTDSGPLATVVLDLITCLLTSQLNEPVAGDSHQRMLYMRVLSFIEERLADPNLSPVVVAAAHQISVRYLQLLFQDHDLTASGWIRRQRLERCRRDLADPLFDARPVHAVGARWGFADAAAFSRTFRREHGTPPGEYRREQQRRRQLR